MLLFQIKFIVIIMKHVLNVGLWTSRKNQAEVIEYAKLLPDVQFHFVGILQKILKNIGNL